jgi:hypothetical protein
MPSKPSFTLSKPKSILVSVIAFGFFVNIRRVDGTDMAAKENGPSIENKYDRLS